MTISYGACGLYFRLLKFQTPGITHSIFLFIHYATYDGIKPSLSRRVSLSENFIEMRFTSLGKKVWFLFGFSNCSLVNFASFASSLFYFSCIALFNLLSDEYWMSGHKLSQKSARSCCVLNICWVSCCSFMCRNLSSSVNLTRDIFCCVNFEAGDVRGTGVRPLFRHCLLKYMFEMQLYNLIFRFWYLWVWY
jgi:hypothetical protein